MKRLLTIIVLISFSMAGCYSTGYIPSRDYDNEAYNTSDDYNQNYNNNGYNTEVSYQVFYDQLQPYGNWINYPGFGYVWQPSAGIGFRPYETNGHWVTTLDGWAWASDYSWGWAPFHYGRWLHDPAIGWAWVPGYEWAPAWVTWGRLNDYYAWAPLAPGINIGMGSTWRAPYNYWSCVPQNRIYHSNLNQYVTRPDRNNIVNNITIINNYNTYNKQNYYHRGPEYQEVERFTRRKITPVPIASSNTPGVPNVDEKRMRIYRPLVSANVNSNVPAPSKVVTLQEIKTRNLERTNGLRDRVERPYAQPQVGGQASDNTSRNQGNSSVVSPGENSSQNAQTDAGGRIIRRYNNNTGSYNGQQPPGNSSANPERPIIRPQQLPSSPEAGNIDKRVIRPQQLPPANEPGNIERRIIRPQQSPNRQRTSLDESLIREQVPENNQRVNTRRRALDDVLLQRENRQQNREPDFQNNRDNQQRENSGGQFNNGLRQRANSTSPPAIESREQNINRNFPVQRPANNNAQRPGIIRMRP